METLIGKLFGMVLVFLLMLIILSIVAGMTGQLIGLKTGPFDFAKKILRLVAKGLGQALIELSKIGKGKK